jgi:diguanylate cyclase (GGDEF)-like protein
MSRDATLARSARHSAAASWAFFVTGIAITNLHWAGLLGPADAALFSVLVLAGFVATIAGIVRNRPRVRWPFVCFAGAVFLFFVGGAMRHQWQTLGDLSNGRSLVPDLVTIPGYLLLAVGLFGLGRARTSGMREVDAIVDALMAGLSALAVAWIFLITPTLAREQARLTLRIVLAAYPPLSVFLLVTGFLLVSSGGRERPHAMRLLFGALTFMLVGDLLYMCADARVAELPTSVVDVPYLLANVLFAAMHLHPSSRDLCEPVSRRERPPTRIRIAFVAIALAVPATLVLARPAMSSTDRVIMVLVIVALTASAAWRVFHALRTSARYEAQLMHQATHDYLTGLPNRSFVNDAVQRALARRSETGLGVALLFLDLDRFKLVNDALGHGTGDRLLKGVARRLRHVVPRGGIVSRIGGDEFVIILERVTPSQAVRIAEEVQSSFVLPFEALNGELVSTASIGIAYAAPGDVVDDESLLRDADVAMYEAKERGRDSIALFDANVHERTARRLVLERGIRRALARHELSLHYQPIVDVRTRGVIGVEALLRWQHPELGPVSPLDFVPVAEETGAIVEIGRWVLRTACAQLADWRRVHPLFAGMYVSVNLSPRQLRDELFLPTIEATLAETGLRPADLRVELTESLLVEHKTLAHTFLERLRTLGVAIAIDDFGTGYSSLSYLRKFHVDEVKIDKSFVDDLAVPDSVDESLVAAIVAIARSLGVTTVAEGVETMEQADQLQRLEVDAAQGFLFARPAAAHDVPAAVARLTQLASTETAPIDRRQAV